MLLFGVVVVLMVVVVVLVMVLGVLGDLFVCYSVMVKCFLMVIVVNCVD